MLLAEYLLIAAFIGIFTFWTTTTTWQHAIPCKSQIRCAPEDMGLILPSWYIPCFKSVILSIPPSGFASWQNWVQLIRWPCSCADQPPSAPGPGKLPSTWSNFCKHSPMHTRGERPNTLNQERICTAGGWLLHTLRFLTTKRLMFCKCFLEWGVLSAKIKKIMLEADGANNFPTFATQTQSLKASGDFYPGLCFCQINDKSR